jgi:hypothetical protein
VTCADSELGLCPEPWARTLPAASLTVTINVVARVKEMLEESIPGPAVMLYVRVEIFLFRESVNVVVVVDVVGAGVGVGATVGVGVGVAGAGDGELVGCEPPPQASGAAEDRNTLLAAFQWVAR